MVFRIVYCVTSIGKYFGDVDLLDANTNKHVSLALASVRAGWCTVKGSQDEKNSTIHEELVEAEKISKSAHIGVHNTDSKTVLAATRHLVWAPSEQEVKSLYAKYANKPTPCIVEYVRDGAAFRMYLTECQTFINFSLAGVLAPRLSGANANSAGTTTTLESNPSRTNLSDTGDSVDAKEDDSDSTSKVPVPTAAGEAESWGQQSRHFSELRLLGREVLIVMQSLEKNSIVLGTIIHPKVYANSIIYTVDCNYAQLCFT